MNIQIENGMKVVVSAALAAVLTLIMMTGIGGAVGPQPAQHAALSAQAPVPGSHAG